MRKPPPCVKDGKPCEKRRLGCQSSCKEMADWKAELEFEKEQRQAYRERDTVLNGHDRYIKKRTKQIRNRGGGKRL